MYIYIENDIIKEYKEYSDSLKSFYYILNC